ncbi:MAG: hypothetical protein OJF50_004783 [Nitrospira sp.]|nr:hypothetical protein [Nitrospira sp.]
MLGVTLDAALCINGLVIECPLAIDEAVYGRQDTAACCRCRSCNVR